MQERENKIKCKLCGRETNHYHTCGDCLKIYDQTTAIQTIVELKDKLHRRNMQIKDLKKEWNMFTKILFLIRNWCIASAKATQQQEQIKIYNDTLRAIDNFIENYDNYKITVNP